jgi:hypothetical protein
MRALVVYESMFGNTRQVAQLICEGISEVMECTVVNVNDLAGVDAHGADLLVVGAPTHAFSLSLPASRAEAAKLAADPARKLVLEPSAAGIGIREFLETLAPSPRAFAAFDTRVTPDWMRSSARKHIARVLKESGRAEVDSTSFRVDRDNRLRPGELPRARRWAHTIATDTASTLLATAP